MLTRSSDFGAAKEIEAEGSHFARNCRPAAVAARRPRYLSVVLLWISCSSIRGLLWMAVRRGVSHHRYVPAERRSSGTSLHIQILGFVLVRFPHHRIVQNVVANFIEGFLVANNVIVESGLPCELAEARAPDPLGASRFELTDNGTQRTRF